MYRITNSTAQVAARTLLSKTQQFTPPTDLLKIVDYFNAGVFVVKLPDDIFGCTLPAQSQSGYKFMILISSNQTDGRKIFTLAHEIAHIALGHLKLSNIHAYLSTADKSRMERVCDVFATELLMPKAWVKQYFYKYRGDVDKLADLFCTSKEAMRIRIEELRLI